MTATPISRVERFIDPGVTRVYSVDSIASLAAPLRVELDAGIDVTGEIAAVSGFALESTTVDSTGAGDGCVTEELGDLRTQGQPRIAMYADPGGYDARSLWGRGDAVYLVFLHGGDIPGHLMDVWPVQVASVSKPIDYAASDAALVVAQFVVADPPVTDVEVP